MSFYFDNAATTFPKPQSVYDFMDSFYRTCGGNASRGQYKQSADSTRLMSETREGIKKLLQCPNKDVIFTSSATIALNMVIQGLIENEDIHTVCISPFEHNAVTRILEHYKNRVKVIVLPIKEDFTYSLEDLKTFIDSNCPELVILSHGSNVCGIITPVEEICSFAKVHKAFTVLDMAQTAGLVPLYTGNNDIDFAIFEGHKTLLGPFGVGGFVKSREINLMPVLFGGTGIESANQDMPKDAPARYEMGSQNIQAIAGLHEAVNWWNKNTEEIRAKEAENHKKLCEILHKYDFIKIVGPKNRKNLIGVVSCLFDGYSADEIGNVLDGLDIAVRTGLQCAPLAHKTLGTFPSGTVRFSVQYNTTEMDFKGLEEALNYIRDNM